MKVKGKAKQLFCMACAFVASFLVTVTAFAAVDISNDNFYGTYEYPNNSSHSIENHDGEYVWLRIYRDDNYYGYFSGISYNFKISNSPPDEFYAECELVTQVNPSTGRPYSPLVRIDSYIATGDVSTEHYPFGFLKSITIKSKQSSRTYVK